MATYVMSDIHGLYDKFEKMMNLINLKEDDKVYFLGDVIDRGPDGIKILKIILKDPRFTLLMGNHEYMMMDTLREGNGKFIHNVEYMQWMMNGCKPTLDAYLELSEEEQLEIYQEICNLPLAITNLEVNGRKFYLTHACYGESEKEGILYREDVEEPMLFVWQRVCDETPMLEDRTLIAGHTITACYSEKYEVYTDTSDIHTAKYIDIDCGCACNHDECQFACLRLDDMKIFYVK